MISIDFKIQVFLALQRTGSFTKAAAELGVSQPAVSQNISELERSLGHKLFERMRSGVEITEAGRMFLKYAQKIVGDYAELNAAMDNSSDSAPQRLTLFMSTVIAELIGDNLLSNLYILRPDMEINVTRIEDEAEICVTAAPGDFHDGSNMGLNITVTPESHAMAPLIWEAIRLK